MSTSWCLVCGAVAGVGVLYLVAGLRGLRPSSLGERRRDKRPRRDEKMLTEALAVWIEQLRDTMAGARGLEQAVVATAETAPDALRPAVTRLTARLGYTSLAESARQFADDVDHPSCDFATAALITASEQQVRDVGTLLDHLARCCRDEVRMQQRIWVSRARTRSAVRIISFVVVGFVAGLFALNRDYLAPYGTPVGSVVFASVVLLFVVSLFGMQRLSRIDVAPRFVRSQGSTS